VNSSESPPIVEPFVESHGSFPDPTPKPAPVFIDANNPPWGIIAAFGIWIGSIILLVFIPIMTAVPYLVYRASTGAAGTPDSLMADKNFIFFSVVGVIPAHLLTLGLAWAVVTRFGRYPFWKTLGWQWPVNFGPWKSVGIAIALLGVGLLITWLVGGKRTELDELINSSYRTRVATAVLAATTGPLVEEIVYRGILYSALQKALGAIWGILIVALLFAGVHVWQYRNNVGVILVITILSLTLTAVRAFSGRLLPSFVIHFVFNAIQSVLLVLQKPEPLPPKTLPAEFIASFLRHFV
jgi:CAAX protease family protein